MSESKSQRRRTIVVYNTSESATLTLAESSGGAGGEGGAAPQQGGATTAKEKLSKYKNLIYSPREAELLEELAKFCINKQPGVVKEFFNLTDKADHDDLALCLVALSYSDSSVFTIIKYFIDDEFKNNTAAGQVMRENCVASKIMKAYLIKFGQEYLQEVLGAFVTQVCVSERKHNYEINPGKVDAEDIEKNRGLLEKKCTEMLKSITSKEVLAKMPAGLRIIAKYVAENARKAVPDQVFILIGSFIFLRFFNPAIFSPEANGLLPKDKVPSSQSRRNLILITKVLQNISNAKTFSNKEQFMTTLNPFVEKNFKVLETYFDELVNFSVQPATVHANLEEVMLSVNDLHIFHSLVFQHKDKVLPLFSNDADKTEFQKLLDKLGSYETKVSFSFLGDKDQRQVKKIMAERKDEASYIGYVEVKGKKKAEKNIIIVSNHRILWAKPAGEVVMEAHQYDLKSISSPDPKQLKLTFKDLEVEQTSDETDIIIDSIRRQFEFCFHSMPAEKKPKIDVKPESRVSHLPPTYEVCDGIVSTYKSLCDYYGQKVSLQALWDLEHLYANNRTIDFKKFTFQYLEPLTDKDALPLFNGVAFNQFFTKIIIKHFRFEPKTFQGLIEMMTYNSVIEDLTLSDIQISDKSKEMWNALFEAFGANSRINVKYLDFANSQIDDKAMVPLGTWIRKYSKPVTYIDLSNTCGEKAGKGTGMLGVFDGLQGNKIVAESLEVLKLSKNKLPGLEPPLTRITQTSPKLRVLELSQTSLDLSMLCSMGLSNNVQHLQALNLSGNKFSKPEQWSGLLKWLESADCKLTELNISQTQVPVATLQTILTKLNANCSVAINVADNGLKKEGAKMIQNIGAQITNVNSLDLSDNELSDEGLAQVFEGLYNCPSLTSLNINRNWSKTPSTRTREQAIHNFIQLLNHTACPLEVLHMQGGANSRLREAIIPLLSAIGENKRITELDITGHGFGNKGAVALGRILELNHVLTTLHYDDNAVGLIGLINVKDGLQNSPNLKTMPLPWRDVVQIMNLAETDKNQVSELLGKMESLLMKNQSS